MNIVFRLLYLSNMDNYDDRIKLDIFKDKTTYQNDYKRFKLSPAKQNWAQDRTEPQTRPPPEHVLDDHETFLKWRKGVHVPFNLLWKRKEIIGTNPYEPFTIPEIPEDLDKEQVIKTRPRIYMSPAVSMDDVADPEMRRLLCKHMYTTEWKKATEEANVPLEKREAPNATIETSGDPVQLKTDILPPLPEGFTNRGIKWEDEQRRACVDPTAEFWIHKDPPVKCGACVDPVAGLVPQETKDKIKDLIRRDQLRLAHDEPIPGYAGYRPRISYGVSLSKIDLPVVHPFLSVSQAITKRYAEDTLK